MKLFLILSMSHSLFAIHECHAALSAIEIIQKEEAQVFGKSFTSHTKMMIDADGNPRTVEFKMWMKGLDKTLIKIISPEKDKNLGNLKLDIQLWQFLPKIDRIIKIPPSMMLQSWMGSDFSNDDLVKGGQLSKNYTLKLLGMADVDGTKAFKIEAIPKPNAPIVWGKIMEYVSQTTFAPIKREMFSENGKLIKTMIGSKIKNYNGHQIPSVFTMINHENKNRKSIIEYLEAAFDQEISESIFTQIQLKKPIF